MAETIFKHQSFVIYESWATMIAGIPENQAGQLIKAMCCAKLGKEYKIQDPCVQGMADMIFNQLLADDNNYAETRKKRSEAGKKGGRPKKAKESNAFLEKAKLIQKKQTEPVSVSVSVSDSVSVSNKNTCSTAAALEREFDELWNLYPKKVGRKAAEAAYIRARKHGTVFEAVKTGIENYTRHIRARGIEQQYIKNGDTYFKNAAWDDVYQESEKPQTQEEQQLENDLEDIFSGNALKRIAEELDHGKENSETA